MKTATNKLTINYEVFEDCSKQMETVNVYERTTRMSAEIIFKNGDRRIYHAKTDLKKYAIKEIIIFVKSIEEASGEKVMWRLKGTKHYNMSTNFQQKTSMSSRIKEAFISIFFDI
ncbi:DUF6018 family natural product bioysynthesis protein [Niallia taxi]|uniref:DUF6018 family natural product bioysynthesis protein n=1 Tax=Niallia taxi TaxID=2499688 RepID=UPI002040D7E3|nr:DUF6018 family natural product bioysynthesis protein [Niallia taxi]MCM3216794.1 DUF6018 family natural product bioysynthesis protein [Niallia taxi]